MVGVACGEYSVLQANLLKPDLCERSNCQDEPQVAFHAAPSSRKDRVFERNQKICYEISIVHFGMIWEFVDDIESAGIPYNYKNKLLALNIMSRFCDHIISR
jgi:hypothetical protein